MPKAQTEATKKYQKKVGLIAKSYKLKREDVDAFAAACETAGVSQASQITKMMRQGISMEDDLYIRLNAYADRFGLKVNSVVSTAVTEYLDREENK